MLTVNNLSHSFGSQPVLRGVDLQIEESSLTALIGPSGGGKSVLLKILGGVIAPRHGTVSQGLSCRKEVSLMFQEGALFDSLSVFDNVAFPLVHGNVPCASLPSKLLDTVHGKVEQILGRVGLTKAAYKLPGQLSGGMRRRVSLARAVVAKPKLVFLDDPTCGLDPVASSVIMELIRDLHGEYRPTMILVSHDLRRLLPVAEGLVVLFDGSIVFEGKVFQEPERERAQENMRREAMVRLLRTAPVEVQRFIACRYDMNGEGF